MERQNTHEQQSSCKVNEYLSRKLKLISLISMVMVVFIHSTTLLVTFKSENLCDVNGYNVFIQNFLSNGIAHVAVPIFFIISAYLFFLNFNGTLSEFIIKYKKRTKSLVLPYLLWSIWGLLFFFILQQIPQSKNFFTHELISNYSLSKIINTIFINPLPYQFWFVRDLIVLVAFSPIIYVAIKFNNYIRFFYFLFLFATWFGLIQLDFVIFKSESILFFSFGTYFALIKKDVVLKIRNQKDYLIYAIIWILLVSLETLLLLLNIETYDILSKIAILIGIIAIWSLYDMLTISEKISCFFYQLSYFSFFLYAFHEPILTLIKKGCFFILGSGEIKVLLVYFLAPIITIVISTVLGYYLKKYIPKFYAIITGGR